MAEYVMAEDQNQQEVARELLTKAGDRAHEIQFNPRANVYGGGVFTMPDDLADEIGGDRITRVDSDPVGAQRAANTSTEDLNPGGAEADVTALNTKLLAGEAASSASPATGDNPTYHGPEVDEKGQAVPDEQRTTNKRRRAAAANTTTE
jgi:hypothetical protein